MKIERDEEGFVFSGGPKTAVGCLFIMGFLLAVGAVTVIAWVGRWADAVGRYVWGAA